MLAPKVIVGLQPFRQMDRDRTEEGVGHVGNWPSWDG
jgi:hypothetical protein